MGFLWLVTVRARSSKERRVEQSIKEEILPLLKSNPHFSHQKLARCINCPGEYTWIAESSSKSEIERFGQSTPYAKLLSELEGLTKAPRKQEVWELVT